MRGQEESREASLLRADGVVDPENLLNNHPGLLLILIRAPHASQPLDETF
jgi:hypothetical protein